MTLAICLLTADRPELTRATLESFRAHNPDAGHHLLLHADDGSASRDNFLLADRAGFGNVYASAYRKGSPAALACMWDAAVQMGATWILHLENDIEWVGPIPTRRDAESIRLYGALKMRDGPRAPAGVHIMGTKEPIDWTPAGDGWERGVASWGGQPSITLAKPLLDAVTAPGVDRLKQVSMALQRLDTLRPVENLVWHVGEEATPDHYIDRLRAQDEAAP